MQLQDRSYTWHSAMLIIAAMVITSCGTTGMQRSQDTRTTLETMDRDIQEASRQIEATGASLEALIRPGQTEVKEAFDIYSENVEEMVAMEENFAKHAEQMKERGIEYFEEWEKDGDSYENSQIQQLSEQRRTEVKETYDEIADNSVGVEEAFKSYVTDLQEIQSYLSNDLTTKGIKAISETATEVTRDGKSLKFAIQRMQSAIQNVRAEMSQTGTN